MKEIPLTRGCVALVDDADFVWLSRWKWSVFNSEGRPTYAGRAAYVDGKTYEAVLMHREILGLAFGDGKIADHADRNSFNNQRSNLRLASNSQNAINTALRSNNKSGLKGVCLHSQSGRWQAKISVHPHTYTKLFKTPTEAARWYDEMALKHFGPFAYLNNAA